MSDAVDALQQRAIMYKFKQLKWDRRFLALAEHVAQWSRDPSTKVGAVLVDPCTRQVLGMSYNGFPRGVRDDVDRYADRPTKYKMVVHAEVNAILNANGPVRGATLYVWPTQVCSECAKLVIQAGIARVVGPVPAVANEQWAESAETSGIMFGEAGVHVEAI